MESKPLVSVIMPVYNGERFLREAIDSILNQTFKDFEFIIINDGSTDKTQEIIDSYDDSRIVVINNIQNIGLPKSLNKGLEMARGEYIARMDADDISLLDRLKKQVKFLNDHRNIGHVSNSYYRITQVGKEIDIMELPVTNEEIQKESMKWSYFCHGSSMFRSECVKKLGFYREEFEGVMDYDFCLRLSEKFEVANISEPLYKIRVSSKSITVTKHQDQRDFAELTRILARERRRYGKDRLQIPEKRQEIIDYINSFKEKNATRRAKSKQYFHWAKNFRFYNIKTSMGFLIKSFIANPFYCLYALPASVITKIFKKIKIG